MSRCAALLQPLRHPLRHPLRQPFWRGKRAHRRDARGFTLPEVLVSLFIFGLVSSLLLAVIDMERRSDAAERRRDQSLSQIATVQQLLRTRMEAMHAVTDLHGVGDTLTLAGQPTDLRFDAPQIMSDGPHALQHWRITLNEDGQLLLWQASELSAVDMREATTAGWAAQVLLDRVAAVRFDYFGPDPINGRDAWQVNWQHRRIMPKLIRLKLAFPRGDNRIWPVFMARPWSGVQINCSNGQTASSFAEADCGGAR